MDRYRVVEEELEKAGRKKAINYAIFDSWEGTTVYRSSDKEQTLLICGRMNDRIKEMKEFG